MRVLAPCEHFALRKEPLVQALPTRSVRLYHWAIGHAEGGASGMTPVCWIEAERGLLEGFAGAAKRQERSSIEVREDEDQDVERKFGEVCGFRHRELSHN